VINYLKRLNIEIQIMYRNPFSPESMLQTRLNMAHFQTVKANRDE
jgi:hypothetical protein